jgi:hypothetical protein
VPVAKAILKKLVFYIFAKKVDDFDQNYCCLGRKKHSNLYFSRKLTFFGKISKIGEYWRKWPKKVIITLTPG